LLGLLEAAEVQVRLSTSLLGIQASAKVALDGHFQVRAQLVVEIHIEAAPAKQRENTSGKGARFHFVPFDGQQEKALAGIT
jgi:hypothetical protein